MVTAVADQLAAGVPESDVAKQLVEGGWEQSDASEFVRDIGQRVRAEGYTGSHSEGGGGSGAWGWLIWIGILLFINFLSWAFDWPFWVY